MDKSSEKCAVMVQNFTSFNMQFDSDFSKISSLFSPSAQTVDFFPSIFFIPKHFELHALLEKLTKL